MNQKHVVIVFFLIVLSGILVYGVNQISSKLSQVGVTPTPTPDNLLFSSPAQGNNQNMQQTQVIRHYDKFPGVYPPDQLMDKVAQIQTSKGNITLEIYPEATKAASNFIFLATHNFYDGLTFHRVEPGFVIQGGDPKGDGTGGPGYQFEDEPVTKTYDKGTLAMANSGPNTNGSQFFIMLDNHPDLPLKYTIFGHVLEGMDVVEKIKVGDVMQRVLVGSKQPPR